MRKFAILAVTAALLLSVIVPFSVFAEETVAGGDMLYVDLRLFKSDEVLLPLPVITDFKVKDIKINKMYDAEGNIVNFEPAPKPFSEEDIIAAPSGWYENVVWFSIHTWQKEISVSKIEITVDDKKTYDMHPAKLYIKILEPQDSGQQIVPVDIPLNTPLSQLMRSNWKLYSYKNMDITEAGFTSSQAISKILLNKEALNSPCAVQKDDNIELEIEHAPNQKLWSFTYLSFYIKYTLEDSNAEGISWLPRLDLMVHDTPKRIEEIDRFMADYSK